MKKISLPLILVMIMFILILIGCSTAEKNIRGVPDRLWQYLTAEQKQIIIDRSFNEEFAGK